MKGTLLGMWIPAAQPTQHLTRLALQFRLHMSTAKNHL